MAKALTATEQNSITVGNFTFDLGLPIPAATRSAVKASGESEKLAAMPVGASFLVPVTVPDSVVDAERPTVFKEKTKALNNRLSGLTRRFTKKNPGFAFALRTVNDDTLGHGVRVFRIEAGAPTPVGTGESNAPASA